MFLIASQRPPPEPDANGMFFPTCTTFPRQCLLFPYNVHYSPTTSTIFLQCPLFPDMLHFFPTKR
jgi:hypothetical protein